MVALTSSPAWSIIVGFQASQPGLHGKILSQKEKNSGWALVAHTFNQSTKEAKAGWWWGFKSTPQKEYKNALKTRSNK